MKEMLDSHLLRSFLAVLDHRKLTTAADELCVTQPALSKSLKRLEDELGVPLFLRTPSGMLPTTYGLTLGRRARQIHLESLGARSELQLMREGGYGSFTIGIGPMCSVHAFPNVIADIIRTHPKTQLKIISGVLDTLLPRLLKGELDMVIASLDFPDHTDLVKEALIETEHVIVAHENHALASRSHVSPRELLDYPFIGFAEDYAGAGRMEKYFASHGIPSPGMAIESSSLEMLLSLLPFGDFLASLSEPIFNHNRSHGITRIKLTDSFWKFSVGAVYRPGTEQQTLFSSILQALRKNVHECRAPAQESRASERPAAPAPDQHALAGDRNCASQGSNPSRVGDSTSGGGAPVGRLSPMRLCQ